MFCGEKNKSFLVYQLKRYYDDIDGRDMGEHNGLMYYTIEFNVAVWVLVAKGGIMLPWL